MYPGGKGNAYQKIINLIPPHDVYIESHLGGGTIMQKKRPARVSIGLDLDPAPLAAFAAGSPGSIVNNDDFIAASDLAMLQDGINLFHWDAVEFLDTYNFTGREFVYSDPPYVVQTRRTKRPIYDFEYTDQDHEALLSLLVHLPCPVMISGYWSELYADTLAGWHTFTFTSVTRGGSLAEEWLWMNYPEPKRLHDYQYLGDTFRERERIKRKKSRWVNRLERMDGHERRAILWALRDAGIIEG